MPTKQIKKPKKKTKKKPEVLTPHRRCMVKSISASNLKTPADIAQALRTAYIACNKPRKKPAKNKPVEKLVEPKATKKPVKPPAKNPKKKVAKTRKGKVAKPKAKAAGSK